MDFGPVIQGCASFLVLPVGLWDPAQLALGFLTSISTPLQGELTYTLISLGSSFIKSVA
jgi:hypothetical protein